MLIQKNNKSYLEAIELLRSQGKFHIKLGLERVSKMLKLLENPQDKIKTIHVAGTNGKGSTIAMLSAVLKETGYKTGIYTSPHLIDYTERTKINGVDISQEDFSELLFKINEIAVENKIHLTEFELLTVMAFMHFKNENVDLALIETGLGGRLDATNVIKKPLVSIISSIDLDHIDRLGCSIEEIAREKAGIIKANAPVVVSKTNKGLKLIEKRANDLSSELYLADVKPQVKRDYEKNILIVNGDEYELPLLGLFQAENLSLVFKSIEVLNNCGFDISSKKVKNGLKNTVWQARLQYIKDKNLIIDGAHNVQAAKVLRESLDYYFPDKKRVWLYSSLKTKDYKSIVKILFRPEDTVICTEMSSMNCVKAKDMKNEILKEKIAENSFAYDDIKKSINNFLSLGNDNNILVVAGSLYMAGEALNIINNN